jgi:hypothetical protein
MKSATKNFHLPLPERLYRELQEEAKRRGRPATVVARGAIQAWLRQMRRQEVAQAIAEYAEKYGGTEFDLDPDLERAGIESWLSSEK